MELKLNLINLCNYFIFVKIKVLPPSATFDGLLPRGIIIQSIDEFSMTG